MNPLRGQNQAGPKERAIGAAKARKKATTNRCYRDYVPPQIREGRKSARRNGTAFVEWTRGTQYPCVCGKSFGSVRFLKKHQRERCGGKP